MKIVSLLPQERSKKMIKMVTAKGNTLTVAESKNNKINTEFDQIFATFNDEASSFDFSKPSSLVCICTSGIFENKDHIPKSIESLANGVFQVSGDSDCIMKAACLSEEMSDEIYNDVVKNSNECADIVRTLLDGDVSAGSSVFVSFSSENVHFDVYFIPISSNSLKALFEFDGNAEKIENVLVKQLFVSVKENPNVVVDFRFGYNCGFPENKQCIESVEDVKKAITAIAEAKINIEEEEEEEEKAENVFSSKEQHSAAAKTKTTTEVAQQKAQKSSKKSNDKSKDKMPKWKQFIYVPLKGDDGKPVKKDGKVVTVVDKSRLLFYARKCARDPKIKRAELEGILDEVNEQIADGEKYYKSSGDSISNLNKNVILARSEESKLATKEACLKQHLVELKTYNRTNENAQKSVMIGDNDDYIIAKECLEEEIESIEKELEFLKLAFPGLDEEEDNGEEEGINEEEEDGEKKADNQEEDDDDGYYDE